MANTNSSDLQPNPAAPRWPACAMLGWGTFGSHDLAGRRYQTRAAIALALMLAGMVLTGLLHLRPLLAIVPGAAFFYIAYEFRRYLSSLDELARRIMMESITWTYLIAGVVAMVLMGIIIAYDLEFHPLWVVVGSSLLEPVRGTSLYFVARRYQ